MIMVIMGPSPDDNGDCAIREPLSPGWRLAIAELREKGCPISSVTGEKIKIREEMRPKNCLRYVIGELADGSGSYMIFGAQGSVADKPLKARQKAVRDLCKTIQMSGDFTLIFTIEIGLRRGSMDIQSS